MRSSFLLLGLICATPSIWFQFSSFLILQISGRLFCPLPSNIPFYCYWYFSGGSVGKESTCNAGVARDVASISGLGRYSGGGHGNPLQYSCLENPMDRGVCQATVRSIAKSWTWLKQLSNTHTHTHAIIHVWFFPSLLHWTVFSWRQGYVCFLLHRIPKSQYSAWHAVDAQQWFSKWMNN